MRIATRGHAVVVGFALTLAAGLGLRADEPKVEGDLKAIQGEWVSKDDTGESVWVFKGDQLTLTTPDRKYEARITLDPNAKPERAIDIEVLDSSPNAKGYKAAGIYKVDEKTLTICFGDAATGRPKEFKGDFQTTFLFELTKK